MVLGETEGITLHIDWVCKRLHGGKTHSTWNSLIVRNLVGKSFKALAANKNKLNIGAQMSMNKTAHDYTRMAA